jgi:hypothetical protein
MSSPVVRCEIVPSMTITGCGDPEQTPARVQPDTGVWVAALAVPDVLWDDEEFRAAVYARAAGACNQWDYPSLPDYLNAIRAELRSRAGGAE